MQYLIMFLEGVITFVSPCLLPLLPLYISYFAGGKDRSTAKTVRNAIAFVCGFTVVFVLMGALAGTLGAFLREYRTAVNLVTGSVVILFGLHFFGVFQLSFFRGMGTFAFRELGIVSSFLFGIVFSVGWTPCVGAYLGSALMMASQQGTLLVGILMLLIYSLGLGIPFVVSALLIDKMKTAFDFMKRNYGIINRISGAILILVGISMVTGLFGRLIAVLG